MNIDDFIQDAFDLVSTWYEDLSDEGFIHAVNEQAILMSGLDAYEADISQ